MGTLRRRRPGDPEKALAKARDPEAARTAAVVLLARRDFASGELMQKLGSQGYDAAVAAELVEAALAIGPDWRELARAIRVRKFGAEPPAEWTEKTRQARFLQYRGFSSDHIRAATGADFDPDS